MTVFGYGEYDEAAIKVRLSTVSSQARVLFAAACAERLFLLYRLFAQRTGQGNELALRAALDLAWGVRSLDETRSAEVDEYRATAESLVPHDDDEDWSELSPLAQNAAAAVAYALRAWLSADAQDGVWAARQAYEAADYLVQLCSAVHRYSPGSEGGPPFTILMVGIHSALGDCESSSADRLRSDAEADSKRLLDLIEADPGG